ncbi:MAG: DUF1156 domain-containing protein, partial [Planktothrix sp.]
LAEFFPSLEGETVQNYLWAHTVVCPSCQSVVPLSPNWWLYKRPEKQNLSKWCAAKPIPNPEQKRVDFELVKGRKGKGTTIQTDESEYDPSDWNTISRGVGKCPNCGAVIENSVIMQTAKKTGLGYQLYAVAYKKGEGSLEFRIATQNDIRGVEKAEKHMKEKITANYSNLIPVEFVPEGKDLDEQIRMFCPTWKDMFNPRQLLTLVTYVEIINEAKVLLWDEYEREKVEAISTYLALVLDRCVDLNCRLSVWNVGTGTTIKASITHSLNLNWNYPEFQGYEKLWNQMAKFAGSYQELCHYIGTHSHSANLPGIEEYNPKTIQINPASADSLFHIPDNSVDAVVTDPPYYSTIQYAEISDFFYVWMKRTLGDIFPDLFGSELTDKDREAVANPSRFRNMGASPDELAAQDYEAKMALAFAEYYRVLRDDGVMTVQFNHKESGAWDVLTKSLIDSGFE